MVEITEIMPPAKVSGLSSFLVRFQFRQELVDALKTIPGAYYHKKLQVWEVPANRIAETLDILTFLDQVSINLYDYEQNAPEREYGASGGILLNDNEINSFKVRPYDHQLDAINYGLAHPNFLLLDSMGLGKTNEIIWLAETLKRRGLLEHCFIICGVAGLKQNWKKEIQKFSTESVLVLGEKISKNGKISYMSIPERAKQLKEPISEFFVVTNVETLRSDQIIEAFKKSTNKFGMIAVDEAHRVATKTSQQGANLLKLDAQYKIAATGTLITNSPISCYVPLAWTGNDHASLTQYKAQYCEFGGFNGYQIVGYRGLDLLKDELDSCSLRRTLDQVRDMPPKTVTYELLEMDDEHRKFYDAIKDGVKAEADKIELNSNNLLALATRLRQASVCPGILTSQKVNSTKIARAVELIQDLWEQHEKVVVLSIFKESVATLSRELQNIGIFPLIATGDLPDQVCFDNMQKFQDSPNPEVFIGTWAKAATGFTLNAAQYMICLDTPYTDALFSQGTDRIWRITNDKPAFVTVLACEDSVDERVMEIVETKKELGDFLVDGKVSDSFRDELLSIVKGA